MATNPGDSPIESTKELHESKERKPEPTKPANYEAEVCERCGFTYYNHLSNTDALYPCWTPSGRYSIDKRINHLRAPQPNPPLFIPEPPRVGLSRGAEPETEFTVSFTAEEADALYQAVEFLDYSKYAALKVIPDKLLSMMKRGLYASVSPPRGEAETPTDTRDFQKLAEHAKDVLARGYIDSEGFALAFLTLYKMLSPRGDDGTAKATNDSGSALQ